MKPGGIFVNADVVLGENDELQGLNMKVWREFMIGNVSPQAADEKWIPQYYKEDRPTTIMKHLDMLRTVGFKQVDVVWKYYGGAVFTAVKT